MLSFANIDTRVLGVLRLSKFCWRYRIYGKIQSLGECQFHQYRRLSNAIGIPSVDQPSLNPLKLALGLDARPYFLPAYYGVEAIYLLSLDVYPKSTRGAGDLNVATNYNVFGTSAALVEAQDGSPELIAFTTIVKGQPKLNRVNDNS
jgi:hypothetical protein